MDETELRTMEVFVNVSNQYSRIEPGNISIADSNMGLLFVVMVVVELDAPAEEDGSTSVPPLLQDDDEASHSLISFDDDILGYKHLAKYRTENLIFWRRRGRPRLFPCLVVCSEKFDNDFVAAV